MGGAAYEATFCGWLGDADVTQDGDVGEAWSVGVAPHPFRSVWENDPYWRPRLSASPESRSAVVETELSAYTLYQPALVTRLTKSVRAGLLHRHPRRLTALPSGIGGGGSWVSVARLTKILTWLDEGWGFPFRSGGGDGRCRRPAMQARWSKIAVVDEGGRYGGEPGTCPMVGRSSWG
ncbi:hypothetical protein Scel_62830 [Streptomyces cellostaticus]|nr:hypothetical protein Scel_62830 [Streptomyces cellostaticus]